LIDKTTGSAIYSEVKACWGRW